MVNQAQKHQLTDLIPKSEVLRCWKAEHLCLQLEDSWEPQAWLLGCGCIATRQLFLTYPTVGVPWVTTQQQDCYIHCHTPVEQISASNSHWWHHPWTEKNKFWHCQTICVTTKAYMQNALLFIHTCYWTSYFQNDPMLTSSRGNYDLDVTFDLFHIQTICISWRKLLLKFCNIWWEKQKQKTTW